MTKIPQACKTCYHCTREKPPDNNGWQLPHKKTGSLAFIETLFFIYCVSSFFCAVNLYTLYRCMFALKAWLVSCHEREEIQQPSTECQRFCHSLNNMADQSSDTGQSMMGVADTHSLVETIPPFWFFFFCLQVSEGYCSARKCPRHQGNPLKMLRCWHG